MHAPGETPQVGGRGVCLHTTCSDCAQRILNTTKICPTCRIPIVPQPYSNIHIGGHSCAQAFLFQPTEGVLEARFCGSRLSADDPYCQHHYNGTPMHVASAMMMERNTLLSLEESVQMALAQNDDITAQPVIQLTPLQHHTFMAIFQRRRRGITDPKKLQELAHQIQMSVVGMTNMHQVMFG